MVPEITHQAGEYHIAEECSIYTLLLVPFPVQNRLF